jgi:nitrogen fixation protein FixH
MLFDFFFIYLANQSYNGTVTPNAYEKGLNYNQVIDKNKKQMKQGWKGNLKYEPFGDNNIKFTFSLKDNKGHAIANAHVKIHVLRPVTDKYDVSSEMKEVEPGIYQEVIELPLPGQWEARVKAWVNGQEHYISERLIIG